MRSVVRAGPGWGVEMTQVVAEDAVPLGPSIPRPRMASVLPSAHVRATRPAGRARPGLASWRPLTTEVVVTGTVAAALAVATGPAPAAVAAAALTWLLLLTVTGHLRRPCLGESRALALRRVLGAGARAVVLAAASAPLLSGAVAPGDLLRLAAAFTAASAAVALATPPRCMRVVLVGPPQEARAALAELDRSGRHQAVAVCTTRRTRSGFGDVPTYAGLRDATRAITEREADAIVVLPGSTMSSGDLRRLQWDVGGSGASLYLGTGLLDVAPRRTRLVAASGLDVLHVAPAALSGPRRALKDALERALALGALVTLAPLLAALAVAVRRDSPGPALFRQERVGKDGRTFEMLKFRSMIVDAETERTELEDRNEGAGVLFKIRHDPRVSRVGRWLRRYSLDELPQLWNVVRGDMSLVGPRPALPEEVARYDVDPLRRLVVKPGVTGLWQVSGRSDLSWEESVRLDLRYVDNWSLSLDAVILCRTVRAVLDHRGAY